MMEIISYNDLETVNMKWNEEAEDIWEDLSRFKRYLLAAGYSKILVERIVCLNEAQFAKYKLTE